MTAKEAKLQIQKQLNTLPISYWKVTVNTVKYSHGQTFHVTIHNYKPNAGFTSSGGETRRSTS